MQSLKILLYISIGIFITSCVQYDKNKHKSHLKHAHWSYAGETSPEHWKEIEKNSYCDGNHQSPINIIHRRTDSVNTYGELEIKYTPKTFIKKVENNGHSIQFDFEPGDSIIYQSETYYLKQIHFHEPSEHKINGLIYPIEMHLVHVSKSGKITVLGLLGEEGEESQLFEFLESFLPLANGTEKEIHQNIDLSDLLLQDKHYYTYGGSLTTPPCTEGVNWVVFKEPFVLSVEEVIKLRNNMPLNNYRNEQPINNRKVNFNY